MKRSLKLFALLVSASSLRLPALIVPVFVALSAPALVDSTPTWLQWAGNEQHSGTMPVSAQPATAILSDTVVDPHALANYNENGDLLAHYQDVLLEGNSVYMEFKGGTFTSIANWQTQSWGMKRMDWKSGALATIWTFSSDWKPVPFGRLGLFEPRRDTASSSDRIGSLFSTAPSRGLGLRAGRGRQPVQAEKEHGRPRHPDQALRKLD